MAVSWNFFDGLFRTKLHFATDLFRNTTMSCTCCTCPVNALLFLAKFIVGMGNISLPFLSSRICTIENKFFIAMYNYQPLRLAKSSMAKQYFSRGVNAVCDGSLPCWNTTALGSPCGLTPTPPARNRTKLPRPWATSWRRYGKETIESKTAHRTGTSLPVRCVFCAVWVTVWV